MAHKILVVEDSPTQAERLRLLLERVGYRVDLAPNGREGLKIVQSTPPDLIISDVVMPEMDGYALCQAVKSAEATKGIPFVLLTERKTPQDILWGLERGADNFITKPFEDDHLLERVGQIFENLEFRKKGALDVEVTLKVSGRPITITADKQQIIEGFFATYGELCRVNNQLLESQGIVEEVGRLISRSLDPEEVAQQIADSLCTLLGGPFSIIYRLDPQSGDLVPLAVSGDFPPGFARGMVFPRGMGVVGLAIRTGGWVVTPNILTDPRITLTPELRARIEQGPYQAALGVPLLVQNRVIGGLGFGDREGRVFNTEEIRVAQIFADQAAIVLENARLYNEVNDSRDFLQSITSNSADAIVTTDLSGRITYFSPGAEEMFGYRAGEILGQPVIHFYRSGREDGQTIMQRLRAEGKVRHHEIAFRAKDGRWVEASLSASLLRDTRGGVVGTLGVIRDITARKDLETRLRQAQKIEAIGRLAGGIAHDFNNLLTVIRGRSELMRGRLKPAHPLRRDLDLIHETAGRATELTRQLLAFSRKQVLQPKVLDLNAVVAGFDLMLRRLIGEHIELHTVPGQGLGRVKADPSQLEQVILNLAINARDAMPEGGKLTLETANFALDEAFAQNHPGASPGAYVRLAVIDTGVGMDAETQARLFEPFFTTKGVGKGTGLGLSTVYGIIKQHGGYIEVESAPGRGTAVRCYLPRVEETVETVERGEILVEVPRGGETILLVEDEEGVRELVREILQGYGYTVLEARDAGEALRISEQHPGPIPLLLTDVIMPEMSGREVAQRLARLRPELRVLYMSGYTDDALAPHGVLDPGTALLEKPFTPDTLARKVRKVLDGK